jgi:hypothetical protein
MKKIFSNNQQYASSPWLQAVSKKNHIPSFYSMGLQPVAHKLAVFPHLRSKTHSMPNT